MRFSLRWLFILIFLAALGIVALLNADRTWSAIIQSALIIALSLSIVGGIFTTGAERAFGFGTAIVGWIYFGAMHDPRWNLGDVLRKMAYDLISTREKITAAASDGSDLRIDVVSRPDAEQFDYIFKLLLVGFVGVVGGCVAVWFYSRRHPRPAPSKTKGDSVTDHT